MTKTYFILQNDGPTRPHVVAPTSIGYAYTDVFEEIWLDTYRDVEEVVCWTKTGASGITEDVTRDVVEALAERTFERGETPAEVGRLCWAYGIDCFDPERDAHMLRDPNAEHRLGARELGVGRWL